MPKPQVYTSTDGGAHGDAFRNCEFGECRKRPDLVVHYNKRSEAPDPAKPDQRVLVCDESFYCQEHFDYLWGRKNSVDAKFTAIEYELWLKQTEHIREKRK